MTRAEAINIFKDAVNGAKDERYISFLPVKLIEAMDCAIEALEHEPKTGKWIHRNDDHFDWYECSECGYGDEGEVGIGHETPYCPYCGSKNESEG